MVGRIYRLIYRRISSCLFCSNLRYYNTCKSKYCCQNLNVSKNTFIRKFSEYTSTPESFGYRSVFLRFAEYEIFNMNCSHCNKTKSEDLLLALQNLHKRLQCLTLHYNRDNSSQKRPLQYVNILLI